VQDLLKSVADVVPGKPPPAAPRFTTERLLAVRPWTPRLLSFRTSRSPGFRFKPGHYTRLGLGASEDGRVWRPFSFVSAAHDPYLEFVAVLVPGGAFSEQLGGIRVGATMCVDNSSYGFLTIEHFAPGRDLWLMASGTGLGPFVSMLRDPATWAAFQTVVVVHSVRHAEELAYRDEIAALANGKSPSIAAERLTYVPVVTREACIGALDARIPRLIDDGRLEAAAGVSLDPVHSRIMVCGNPDLGRALRQQLTGRGFRVNRRGAPGQLAFENYWQGSST
jgi:ferredoxin--NADP+ reductase